MSYRIGKMGVAEGIALVCISVSSHIFLMLPARAMSEAASLAWLVVIISGMVSLLIVLMLIYLLQSDSEDLIDMLGRLLGKKMTKIVLSYYIAAFGGNVVLLLRQFIENTLLSTLPEADFNLILIFYMIFIITIVYIGIEPIARSCYLLLPVIALALITVGILLLPLYDSRNLLPWFGTGAGPVLQSALTKVTIIFPPILLLFIAPALQDKKAMRTIALFSLGLSTVMKSFTVLVFTLVFGVAVGQEKMLPFFEMARLVYLNRYLQHIEAIFIPVWIITGILSIAISLYMTASLLTRLLNLPSLRPLLPLLASLLIQLTLLPPTLSDVFKLETFFNQYLIIGTYLIPVLLMIISLIKRRRTPCSTD